MPGLFDDIYIQENITVTTTATELVPTGGANSNRGILRIYNKGDETIYFGPDNTVTSSGASQGEPLFKDQWIALPFNNNLTVFGITASGTATVLIQEISCEDVENF